MNDEAFPRVRHSLGFDLVAKSPRLGDRTTRDDDRYLFLEALLAARERLVLTFVGQSARDGGVLPPSVVVSELLDALSEAFVMNGRPDGARDGTPRREQRERVRRALVIQHPLQPFSVRYFESDRDPRFDMHSALFCEAASRLVEAKNPDPPFLAAALPVATQRQSAQSEGVENIDLDRLIGFFRHPSRVFLRDRLQISLREELDEVAGREPFVLDSLDEFQLGSELLEQIRAGASDREAYAALRGSGRLPHGSIGRIAFENLLGDAKNIADRVRECSRGETLGSVSIDIEVGGARLYGVLPDIGPEGQVSCRFSKLGRAAELSVWLQHLVLQVAAAQSRDQSFGDSWGETVFVGRPEKSGGPTLARFAPSETPERELAEFVRLYRIGMAAPLPLFANSSRTYAQAILKQKSPRDAAQEARKLYQGSSHIRGEILDPYNALAFKGVDFFDPAAELACGELFDAVAQAVFGPLLGARETSA
jgi:exodeoxyribonuclease V gamma subunit